MKGQHFDKLRLTIFIVYWFQADISSLLKLIPHIYRTFRQTKMWPPSQLPRLLVTRILEKRLDTRKWSQTSCRCMRWWWSFVFVGWLTYEHLAAVFPEGAIPNPTCRGRNRSRIAGTAICSATIPWRHYRMSLRLAVKLQIFPARTFWKTRYFTKLKEWTPFLVFSCKMFQSFHSSSFWEYPRRGTFAQKGLKI